MSEAKSQILSGVPETLLITLYLRAMETQRPDALIRDKKAAELVQKISDDGLYDFSRMRSLHLSEENKLVIILRNREFDRCTQDFLRRHPQAVVVHIGCGFDTRFERVDNGQVEWYDLDVPEVIDLRRKLIGEEAGRHHLLGCSVLEPAWLSRLRHASGMAPRQHDAAWLDRAGLHHRHPFLFLAEGVFMYFTEAQVRRLVLTLCDRFPGAELIFDAYSPIHVWRHNLQYSFSKIKFLTHWGIWHGQEIEAWGKDIHLVDEWGYFDDETLRLTRIRWLRGIETVTRTFRIYRFQLAEAAE